LGSKLTKRNMGNRGSHGKKKKLGSDIKREKITGLKGGGEMKKGAETKG